MVAVSITREEHDAADLRREASRSRDADAARRMLALALVLEGASRTDAARTCGTHLGHGPADPAFWARDVAARLLPDAAWHRAPRPSRAGRG